MEPLHGTVKSHKYYESSGYVILKLDTDKGLVTVKGNMLAPRDGMAVHCEGDWTTDERGTFFKAKNIEEALPHTRAQFVQFCLTACPGMSPVDAERLVDRYGESTFAHLLRNDPARMSRETGIHPDILSRLSKRWTHDKATYDLQKYLSANGLNERQRAAVYKRFQSAPNFSTLVDDLAQNPYLLVQCDDVSFKHVDVIAAKRGIAPNNAERCMAALRHAVTRYSQFGNTVMPLSRMARDAAQILAKDGFKPSPAELERYAESAVKYGYLEQAITIGDSEPRFALPHIYEAEVGIARSVTFLASRSLPKLTLPNQEDILRLANCVPSAEQIEAMRMVALNPLSIITGGPGCGKTTVARLIVAMAEHNGNSCVLVAPTGRAAKRLSEATGKDATTIHRLLGVDPQTNEFRHNANRRISGDFLLVDELSIVDVEVLNSLLQAVPNSMRILFVGDADQLPSVGAGNVMQDLLEAKVPSIRLHRVFRQAGDSPIITAAHCVNERRMPEMPQSKSGDVVFIPARLDLLREHKEYAGRMDHAVQELVVSTVRELMQAGAHPTNIQVLTPMKIGPVGSEALSNMLARYMNPMYGTESIVCSPGSKDERSFELGDRVMCHRNNYRIDLLNGDIGYIVRINQKKRGIELEVDGKIVRVSSVDMRDLRRAYACTIHKSQGSEYPFVILPLTTTHARMLHKKLVYTAITRAKQKLIMVGDAAAMQIAISSKGSTAGDTAAMDGAGTPKDGETRQTMLCDLLKYYCALAVAHDEKAAVLAGAKTVSFPKF